MAVPAWATNLTDIYLGGAGSFSALGGGAAGLNTETDFFIQGTDCKSKNAWTNAIKGLIHDHGSAFTVPTSGAIIQWIYYSAVGSLDTLAGGGLIFTEGSGTGARNRYYVGGKDTLALNSWVPYVVDPNTATADNVVGSPSGSEQWVGAEADLPTTSGPTKGAPIAVDAIRYGRCDVEYTDGQAADYNDFSKAEAYANDVTRRWGMLELVPGASSTFYAMGFHSFGLSGTAVDFRDANKVILIRDTPFVAAAFNRIEVIHASSNVDWDNIIFQALGTQSLGTFVHTAGTWDAVFCQFIDVGTFTLLAASVFTDCVFRNTGIITAPGSDLRRSTVVGFEGTANTSPLIWDVATDPDGKMDGMSFEMGTAATHAIEFGTNSPLTMTLRDIDFAGYGASDAANDSTFHVKRTSGTVTINIVGGSIDSSYTYRSDGATVVIVQNPVALELHVLDRTTAADIVGARCWVTAGAVGPLPYQDSVTITRVTTTASVAHTAHGLSNGDEVYITGAVETEYNGPKTISNVTANAYDFTVAGSPATPATGTIIATAIIINGVTGAGGLISDTRTYASDQDFEGWVRDSTAPAPFYEQTPLTGSIDKDNGRSVVVGMQEN